MQSLRILARENLFLVHIFIRLTNYVHAISRMEVSEFVKVYIIGLNRSILCISVYKRDNVYIFGLP